MFCVRNNNRYSLAVLLFWLPYIADSVPFVTRRVSLPQNIKYDFTGWRPLPDRIKDRSFVDHSSDTLTIPVAVETDEEHELSSKDINAIEEKIIDTWRQKQKYDVDTIPETMSPFMSKLIPNYHSDDILTENENKETYTYVKMTPNEQQTSGRGDQKEVMFHAYLADGEHVPEDGYVKLTKEEFRQLFSDAEIHFI